MLTFVPDHLKTKKTCKHSIKKLLFIINVPDQYKTQEMCDKAILENDRTLKSVPDYYKNKKNYKAVDNYAHAFQFVPFCYKTQ